MSDEQHLLENIAVNEAYVREHYPNDKFISAIPREIMSKNKYAKGLIIPVNVKLAESRLPINTVQRNVLRKELLQAEILAKMGNSVYLTPERSAYKVRVTDAIVNGVPYEYKNIVGGAKKVESEFSDAKKKGDCVNVFMTIDSDISKHEARRRIGLVLERNPQYSGKIIVSLKEGKTFFWDSCGLR